MTMFDARGPNSTQSNLIPKRSKIPRYKRSLGAGEDVPPVVSIDPLIPVLHHSFLLMNCSLVYAKSGSWIRDAQPDLSGVLGEAENLGE